MSEINLRADIREGRGKGFNTRLRDTGKLPAVIYGKGTDGIAIQLDLKDIEKVVTSETGRNTIINLTLNGTKKKNKVMIRDLQKDAIKGYIKHIDFYQISLKDKVDTTTPIHLVGECTGVKQGGILQQGMREIYIECLPAEIPDSIEIDVVNLNIGDTMTVADVKVPEGVLVLSDPSSVIVSILTPKLTEEVIEKEVEKDNLAKEVESKEPVTV